LDCPDDHEEISDDYCESYLQNAIDAECSRLSQALLLVDADVNDENVNNQLYTSSVCLSYLCCWARDTNDSKMFFQKAFTAALAITNPYEQFDALITIL
jgi:hypothetical protein